MQAQRSRLEPADLPRLGSLIVVASGDDQDARAVARVASHGRGSLVLVCEPGQRFRRAFAPGVAVDLASVSRARPRFYQGRVRSASATSAQIEIVAEVDGVLSTRIAPRVNCYLAADVMRRGGDRADLHADRGWVVDISETGCGLRLAQPLPMGASVAIMVGLDGALMELPGFVTRVVPSPGAAHIGVAFDDLPQPALRAIQHLVESGGNA